jgi:hypothetical protein
VPYRLAEGARRHVWSDEQRQAGSQREVGRLQMGVTGSPDQFKIHEAFRRVNQVVRTHATASIAALGRKDSACR